MRSIRTACALAALVLLAPQAPAQERATDGQSVAPANLAAAMAEYRRKLDIYNRARQAFDEQASAYWNAISEKRRARFAKRREKQEITLDDYVLTQPPLYTGPPKPLD